jgi:hypothetical protein
MLTANDLDCLSDLHKDAYGFRLHADEIARIKALPPAEIKAIWDSWCADLGSRDE